MKFLVRAFAIMAAVNIAAFLWMGLSLGDWNPANLDSVARNLVEKVGGQGFVFWIAYFLALIICETFMFFLALSFSAAFEGVFWSTLVVTLVILGLVTAKAWDIQKTVKSAKHRVEKAVDKVGDPIEDGWNKLKKAVK